MENNKYYTPTIEEFHVGFEYEHLTGFEKEFKPWIYDLASACTIIERKSISHNGEIVKMFIPAIQACIEEKQCRVKVLDQSDIESLGWESEQYVPERNICLNFKKSNDWYLNYWFGQIPYIEISRDGYDTGCALNVKNKSELIKLQQQLNIINYDNK